MNKGNQNLYAILIDKSSPEMRSKLDVTTGHEQVEAYQDGITLLAMIKNIIYGVEESLQYTMAILMAKKTLHMLKKNKNVARSSSTPTSPFWRRMRVGLQYHWIWWMVSSESCNNYTATQRMRFHTSMMRQWNQQRSNTSYACY